VRDITERKQVEASIQALNTELRVNGEQLKQTNQELEAFSYTVSHDLRAPLRHIDGYARMLVEDAGEVLDGELRRYLDAIGESARRMGMLIDDLLAFSRMGRVPLERRDVDVQKMVAEVVSDLGSEQAARDVQWTIEPLPHVDADPAMLRVVWRNLLDNALKYTRSRATARVQVGSSRREGQTAFFVRDNGVGFDMRFAGRLFGVFQRLQPVQEFAGSGIGLATVRRIVARHAGRTGGEGEVDRGATFWFSLPDPIGGLACPSPA
jgi:light-regulated signal transduction histidine kinase (bacteriophytochrome)